MKEQCPTCGAPCKVSWSGLNLVEESGDETLATKSYKYNPVEEDAGEESQDELWEQAAKILFNHHNPDLRGATEVFNRLMIGFRKDMNLLSSQYIIQKRKQ